MLSRRPPYRPARHGCKGLYGPQGTGLLLCGQPGKPLLCGGTGSQSALLEMPAQLPDRHEAGTANVPGIAGLLAGLQYIRNTGVETILRHECRMREQAARLCSRFDRLRIFTGSPGTQTGALSLVCAGMDTEDLAQCLAAREICVRAGLHCAPLAHRTAGTFETGTVRLSFSAMNHPWQLCALERALAEILE